MNVSSRLVLPLAGAVVLVGAVLGVVLWPEPASPPVPEVPRSEGAASPEAPAARGPSSPARAPVRPGLPSPTVQAPVPQAPPADATVVPIQPGDEVPEPESPDPLPQVNDPIEPEKPQTARWRLEKTERITSLLARDVVRLEQQRDAAAASGNERERQRLDILVRRQQERLLKLREEASRLSGEAQLEPPEQ
ncbi:MAG TPA: hypothetical protein VF815_47295 [Myxococcaceae bacterium]